MPVVIRPLKYESEAERCFGDRLYPVLAEESTFSTQVEYETIGGVFRIDMLITSPSRRRIAIEIDGEQFHDYTRDQWRTDLLFGANAIHCMYRVRASEIVPWQHELIAHLARRESDSFKPDTADRLLGFRDWLPQRTGEPDRLDDDYANDVRQVYARGHPDRLLHQLACRDVRGLDWRERFAFAAQSGLSRLDDMIAAWNAAHPAAPQQRASGMFDGTFDDL